MLKLFIALQLAVLTVRDVLEDRARIQRDERGSVTIQEVLWAVAAIAIAGIVVAAIRAFVTSESGKIK
ncbi:hypothetical protein NOMA109596_01705 [Nocardioides marinus]|jgi:ABC-type multidrug transport system permease subunit|uniref:ABC-type multidrug transport system permease subunit n=1 Tax=Nocardioides marinus TaxID=374514 RepID=A0A7Y9YCJ3_9ACTN|nr:hypothetical protein [Nocardioides marinus]NYI09389.1 ABC-type multidrug transport system permease subunit [Nocardioides marinus]